LILVLHSILVGTLAYRHSVTFDETGHVAAGLVHWKHSDFSMYAVNPPLTRLVAMLPTMPLAGSYDVPQYSGFVEHRAELPVGVKFATEHEHYLTCVFIARIACIPFSWIGGMVCYYWARSLYGWHAGLAALILWCFSPNIQANACQVLPDLAATSLVVSTCFVLRSWLMPERAKSPLLLGCILGVTLLTKFTTVVLIPIILVVVIVSAFQSQNQTYARSFVSVIRQLSICFAIALLVINSGYFFEETFVPLGEYEFVSESLSGIKRDENMKGNRFLNPYTQQIPIPVPKNYILGIDLAKFEFERGYWSYLCGEFQNHGWWYFYLYALAVKEPIGFWGLAIIACLSNVCHIFNRKLRSEEWLLVGTSAAILITVSAQTGYTHHLRYVLPVLPLWYILSSAISCNRKLAVIQVSLVIGFVVSSCSCFPNQISYFNECVGGPSNGWKHLATSNYDWGQNLVDLRDWQERNSDKKPLFVKSSGAVPVSVYGIQAIAPRTEVAENGEVSYPTGWYAICVDEMLKVDSTLRRFLKLEPEERVAYTVFIYRLEKPLVVGQIKQDGGSK
jgi:hypothetical protein